jgi:signal transduction histidine kinase
MWIPLEKIQKKISLFPLILLSIFILGIGITLFVYHLIEMHNQEADQQKFILAVNRRQDELEAQLNIFFNQLNLVVKLFQVFPHVSREEFAFFVKPILSSQVGFQAISWVPYVLPHQRAAYENQARKDGITQYEFTEINVEKGKNILTKDRERSEYWPVFYIEPLESNLEALGFNLGSEPKRMASIQKSLQIRGMTASDPVVIVQEKTHALSVLLMLPVFPYRHGIEEDEAIGLCTAVMRPRDLLNNALERLSFLPIDIYIYDLTAIHDQNHFLYFYNSEPWIKKSVPENQTMIQPTKLEQRHTIAIGDHTWEVIYQAGLTFTPNSFWQKAIIPATGLFLTTLIAIIFLFIIDRARTQHLYAVLEAEVNKRTEELRQIISQLKSTQQLLITQEKLASLGALTAGIAHEIRNPLSFVENFTDLAKSNSEEMEQIANKYLSVWSLEDQQNYKDKLNNLQINLAQVIKHERRINNIVLRMLDHSRQQSAEVTPTDIHDLLEQCINVAYYDLKTKDPAFQVKIEKVFDLSVGELNIVPGDISRVFLNLLDNAFYSVNQKRKRLGKIFSPTISVKTQVVLDRFKIRIRDNGKGIPSSEAIKIFTPFYTTKIPGEGTGLGLSFSYEIITQEHRGTLTFISKEGEFAEFIITLPLIS